MTVRTIRKYKALIVLLFVVCVYLLVGNRNEEEYKKTKVRKPKISDQLLGDKKETIQNQQNQHVVQVPENKISSLDQKPTEGKSLKNDLDQASQNEARFPSVKGKDQMSQNEGIKTGRPVGDYHQCKPKTNVVFIKTIKTGGSTLTNILGRYAMKHNLSTHGKEGCEHPLLSQNVCPLRRASLDLLGLGKSNIISDHLLYNRKILSDVTLNDTIYVTQLRQPLAQIVSWFNYRGHSVKVDPAAEYKLLHPFIKYSKWNSWRQLCIPDDQTGEKFLPYIHLLEKEFDLVTITEQFDVSLLLLRRKLCWDISDMLYIPLKRANYTLYHNEHFQNIFGNEQFNNAYQDLNPNAYSLYNHFNSKLSELITQEGSDLQEELKFFQVLKQKVTDYCAKYIEYIVQNVRTFSFEVDSNNVLLIPASRWGSSQTVDPIDCAMMKLHKRSFQKISVMKKLSSDYIRKHITRTRIVSKSELDLYLASAQPVHPKYGIPLPVLNHAHAYDFNEHVLRHAEMVRHRDYEEEVMKHRATVNNIHSCIVDNSNERHTGADPEMHDMSALIRDQPIDY